MLKCFASSFNLQATVIDMNVLMKDKLDAEKKRVKEINYKVIEISV